MSEQNKYSGTKTEQNHRAAFSGESEARNKYTFFASKAKKEGYGAYLLILVQMENRRQRKGACKALV